MFLRSSKLVAGAAVLVVLAASAAGADPTSDGRFPSDDPDIRVGTPSDPRFDCAEPDDEDTDADCAGVFDEQWQLFGFAPSETATTAFYRDADRFGQGQVSGVRADAAWKLTIGDPSVVVAVTDTGIDWDDTDIRRQVFLNSAELPLPEGASVHDRDGDGAVTVDDWAGDSRVDDANGNELLDGQDLIVAFSDGVDDDGNGYVDDISGWDWLNDDNDPDDTSSVSAARRHGTGRMEEAAQQTNDGSGRAGICPNCRVLALKVWDSFVVPGDNWAEATVYTADIGASVQVVANGVLGNTETMRLANRYAHESGVSLMHVSSDLNTENHNYPTNYRESVYINGCVADTEGLSAGNEIADLGLPLPTSAVTTWFRQAGLTQWGAHAHVCFMGATGSQAVGQAGGAAGLIISRGLEVADQIGGPLNTNEVKQLLTLTAEDVLAENTIGIGIADDAQVGWDEKFGYGRADLGAAVAAVAPGTIPPEAMLHTPQWWHLLDPVDTPTVDITGEVAADRSTDLDWELAYAVGSNPTNDSFTSFATGAPDTGTSFEGTLGTLDLAEVAAAIPGAAEGTPPTDPNQYVFTVRLRVTDADGNVGEDRRAYFAFHDPDQPDGWPRFTNTGGESSLTTWDLDGDGDLEIIEADSSGFVSVLDEDGSDEEFWNGGQPLRLPAPWFHHPDSPGYRSGAVPTPGTQARTPIVADIDADLEPEVVVAATTGEVYVWDRFGQPRPGFPVMVDIARSTEDVQSQDNHVKRGFLANPSAGDLDGDGTLEIVAAALDGHLYVWEHDGSVRSGFPVKVADPDQEFSGGELIVTPALGDLDGDGDLEITLMSNEVYGATTPDGPEDLQGAIGQLVTNIAANAIGGSARAYAFQDDGTLVDGWPVAVNGLLPDILPLVGPAHQTVLVDTDDDGDDEVVLSATSGDVQSFDGDGTPLTTFIAEGAIGNNTDPTRYFNLFEYLAVGDVDGSGGPDVTKLGISTGGIVNLLAAGQNLPFEYAVQAWDTGTSLPVPGFPASHDDFGLLSSPVTGDLTGDGNAEIIAGSGLYLLRSFTTLGQQSEGFPKLTGGWAYGVPLVADLDGDGDVEVLASTREGWRHLWDLDAEATPAAIGNWWMDGHDERHTLRYGSDTRPPTRVLDAAVDDATAPTSVTFTATGDDWLVGDATTYEVRTADGEVPMGGWAARPVAVSVDAEPSGSAQTIDVTVPAGTSLLAVVGIDDVGNRSQPAVVSLDGTPAAPTPTTMPSPVVPPTTPAAPTGPSSPLPATGGGLALLGLLVTAAATRSRRRG